MVWCGAICGCTAGLVWRTGRPAYRPRCATCGCTVGIRKGAMVGGPLLPHAAACAPMPASCYTCQRYSSVGSTWVYVFVPLQQRLQSDASDAVSSDSCVKSMHGLGLAASSLARASTMVRVQCIAVKQSRFIVRKQTALRSQYSLLTETQPCRYLHAILRSMRFCVSSSKATSLAVRDDMCTH